MTRQSKDEGRGSDTGEGTAEELVKELGKEHRTLGRDGEAGDATSPNVEAQRDADDEHPESD